MLEQYPTGIIACVSDSYDIFRACRDYWGTQLKDQVLQRNGVLVIRPDSGDPVPTMLKVLDILGEKFGTEQNEKGYKVLNPKVRTIQGDGNNHPKDIYRMLDTMRWRGWSADNIAFGMGGALLQKVDRDTQKFAIKASAILRDNEWQDVYKTAVGKTSKRGRLVLTKSLGGEIFTVKESPEDRYESVPDLLETVFVDGNVLSSPTLSKIRQRAELTNKE
jgi:nicotinamide phosphoribosyltransferase